MAQTSSSNGVTIPPEVARFDIDGATHVSEITKAVTHVSEVTAITQLTSTLIPTEVPTEMEPVPTQAKSETMHASGPMHPPAPAAARARHAVAVSGAAKAKREQLQRKAAREGLPDDHYIHKYASQKQMKRRAREDYKAEHNTDDVPAHLARSWPAYHAPANADAKRSKNGPRTYFRQSERQEPDIW